MGTRVSLLLLLLRNSSAERLQTLERTARETYLLWQVQQTVMACAEYGTREVACTTRVSSKYFTYKKDVNL